MICLPQQMVRIERQHNRLYTAANQALRHLRFKISYRLRIGNQRTVGWEAILLLLCLCQRIKLVGQLICLLKPSRLGWVQLSPHDLGMARHILRPEFPVVLRRGFFSALQRA